MKVFERTEVARFDVLRVLQCDNVFSAELLFADKISPMLSFDIQTLDSVVSEDIARVFESNDMCVVGEDLESDRIHHFSIIVLSEL